MAFADFQGNDEVVRTMREMLARAGAEIVYRGPTAPKTPAASATLAGKLDTLEVKSAALGGQRKPQLYVPPGKAPAGGWPGVIANAELDPRLRNGALGFTGAVQDLPAYTAGGSDLLVFALPKSSQAASEPPKEKPQ